MSIRSLVEFNHDYVHEIGHDPDDFIYHLRLFLYGGDPKVKEYLADYYGCRFVAERHHSSKYIISKKTDGFPSEQPFGERKAK